MAILGIDEVGRGPWAGPLVMGAVILDDPQAEIWKDLNDSKKLTAKKRELQSEIIKEHAKATGLGWVSAQELDQLGMTKSLSVATKRAICDALNIENLSQLDFNNLPFSEIIIDGTINFLKGTFLESKVSILPKADSKIKEVSAASIIAKVTRDNYMVEIAKKYPEYGFESHVGYGTAAHKKALLDYGPCPEHRFSFRPVAAIAKKMSDQETPSSRTEARQIASNHKDSSACKNCLKTTTTTGKKAEQIVADYLESIGHKILARNHKTKFYEIDIVSATKDHIYFTEVKYRKSNSHGSPLEFIDQRKQKQITFAAESFMQFLSQKLNRPLEDLPNPILAAASVSGKDFQIDQWLTLE